MDSGPNFPAVIRRSEDDLAEIAAGAPAKGTLILVPPGHSAYIYKAE